MLTVKFKLYKFANIVNVTERPEAQTHGVTAQPHAPFVWAHDSKKILPMQEVRPTRTPDRRFWASKNALLQAWSDNFDDSSFPLKPWTKRSSDISCVEITLINIRILGFSLPSSSSATCSGEISSIDSKFLLWLFASSFFNFLYYIITLEWNRSKIVLILQNIRFLMIARQVKNA